MKRICQALILSTLALLLNGCLSGYETGSLQHPQIKKIHVAKVKNPSSEVMLHGYAHQAILDALQNYSTMKPVNAKAADAIVYVTIINHNLVGVDKSYRSENREEEDGKNYGTTIYRYEVTYEFTVLVPGRNRPLITARQITGEARFDSRADLEQTRYYGARLACADASRKLVAAITEAW